MNTSNLTIETKNLYLKAITMECKDDAFKEFTPEITKYMYPKSPEKIEETIEFIEGAMKENEAGSNFQIMILNKETGEYLGNGGLHHINARTPELGIWIKKSAHGHGYGKEAMIAMKEWCDENLDYDYISYPVDKENFASRRIPEAMGGKVFREFDVVNMSGNTLHEVEYRIYKNNN